MEVPVGIPDDSITHPVHNSAREMCASRTGNLSPSSLNFGARFLYLSEVEASYFIDETSVALGWILFAGGSLVKEGPV